MKTRLTKAGTYTITGITQNQMAAMERILTTANDRCFREQESDGDYFSGEDFVCTLTEQERKALSRLSESL